MILINVTPVFHEEYWCFKNQIATILNHINMSHELMFLKSWKLNNYAKNDINGLRLRNENEIVALKLFHGVFFRKITFNNQKKAFSFINNELNKNRLIIAQCDNYYTPWYSQRNILHGGHFFIINGSSNDKLFCTDAHYNKKNEEFEKKNYIEACNGSFVFYYYRIHDKQIKLKRTDIYNELIKIGEHNIKTLEKLNISTESIAEIYDSFIGKDFSKEDIYENLKKIAISRMNLTSVLDFMCRKRNNYYLNECKEILKKTSYNYYTLRNSMVKNLLAENKSVFSNKFENIFSSIIESEKKFLEFFILSQKGILIEKKNYKQVNLKIEWQISLDLSEKFNNSAFATDKMNANFDGEGNFLCIKDKFKENYFNFHNIEYSVGIKTNDNISCNNQVLANTFYEPINSIALLVTAEGGTKIERIKIATKTYKKQYEICVPDWVTKSTAIPLFGEEIAKRGEAVIWVNGEKTIWEGLIYSVVIQLDDLESVENIELPVCPGLHIFAINLLHISN